MKNERKSIMSLGKVCPIFSVGLIAGLVAGILTALAIRQANPTPPPVSHNEQGTFGRTAR